MSEDKLTSLAILVGTGDCNANCDFCAGKPLRSYAPSEDGVIDQDLFDRTLRECFKNGAKYLSISSCGEPTLSPLAVTKTLELVSACRKEGFVYSPVNLYSNGIRIGEDREFCDQHFGMWRDLGLTTVYVTLHDISEDGNAKVYHIGKYPSIKKIFSRLHDAKLSVRANLVLHRGVVDTREKLIDSVDHLREIGADTISTWPLRSLVDDKIDLELSPDQTEMKKMKEWADKNGKERSVRMIYQEEPIHYKINNKLTLFPDGSLANNWCNP